MERHDTILLVSAKQEFRTAYRVILNGHYNLLEAGSIRQAQHLLEQNFQYVAAVLLDITAESRENLKEFQRWSDNDLLNQTSVIMITDNEEPILLNQAFELGADDVIPLSYDPVALLHRIENLIELNLYKQRLSHLVEEQAKQLNATNATIVDTLSSIIEYRSVESGQHILRIRRFTKILLEELAHCFPEYHLLPEDIRHISSAAALHDIGKIAIPDSILMKPGELTAEEQRIMQEHALTGCKILKSLTGLGDQQYLHYAYNICRYHHERWDGGGYPDGLAGDEIPICAQVVGLADAYDALTTKRVYKDAYPYDTAANMILQGKCGQFSPKLLECFKHISKEYEILSKDYADGVTSADENFDSVQPQMTNVVSDDSMERTWAKYQALVHFAGAFLFEMDLDQKLFHLIYNPYPELVSFNNINKLAEIEGLVMESLIVPEDSKRMQAFLDTGIRKFIHEGMRRADYHFRFKSSENPNGEPFILTLLRANPMDNKHRSVMVLCKKAAREENADHIQTIVVPNDYSYCCLNDAKFTLEYTCSYATHLAGYTEDEVFTRFDGSLLELVVPEDRQSVRASLTKQLARGTEAKLIYRIKHKNGRIRWFLNSCKVFVGDDGQERLLCGMTDISPSREESDALKAKLEQYEIILTQTENVLFEWDVLADTISFSDTWEKIFGFEAISKNVQETLLEGAFFHPDDLPQLIERVRSLRNGSDYEMVEVRIAAVNGRYLWYRFRATAVRDAKGELTHLMGIIINVDAEKQAAQELRHRADQDPLTKLLNKGAGRRNAVEYFQKSNPSCALLIIDLDSFKQINDTYGHLFGDTVLTRVAQEIKRLFRNQDIVARIGGDEFMVLMRDTNDRNLVENRCVQLISALQNAFQDDPHNIPITCSIGVSLCPEHGTSYYELFQRADSTLYQIKNGGKNGFAIYNPAKFSAHSNYHAKTAVNQKIDSDEQPGLASENIVYHAFQRLYSSPDVTAAVNDILELIGRQTNVSRVYVFENAPDNKSCKNTYEWCNTGIPSQMHKLQHLSYETYIPDYENNFNEQGIFYCPDISVLTPIAYETVSGRGIKSLLQCAIRENGVFRGFIGFDECINPRFWTNEQIKILRFFAEMLSVFLLKQQAQKRTQQRAEELSSILDNQNAWIYIIDPDTCELKYLNKKTRELAPGCELGAKCYQALQGKQCRCSGCPSEGIREKTTDKAIIHNLKFGLCAQAEATLIQWDGEESCLLTCREITETV